MNHPQQGYPSGGTPPGYPQPPKPKRGMGVGAILGIVVAILFVVGIGGIGLLCMAVKSSSTKAAEANKEASSARAELVSGLVQLAANPKAQKPKTAKEEKDVANYAYDAPPTWGVRSLEMTVGKDRPNAWRISFESPGKKLSPYNFGPPNGVTTADMADGWLDITDGALKGSVVHLRNDGAAADVVNPAFLLSTTGLDVEPKMARWACDSGRAGIKAITVSEFLDQCRAGVRSKLFLPDTADFPRLGVANEVTTTGECGHAWSSSVEAKNALGVVIKHGFACSYTPKKGRVEATISGR